LQSIVDIPQQEFNKKYQFIEKKGLSVELAHEEMESLRDIVFNLACDVLRVEPLKLEQTGKTQDTIDLLEGLATNINSDINNVDLTSTQGLEVDTTDMITQMIRPEEELENTREKTFELKKIRFGFPTNDSPLKVDFSENLKIALIQLHKGVKRKSIVEEDWNLWKRGLDRYFNNQLFRQDKIFQFTDESNNMRVKPKIIGFMDDAIYEGANFVILPELSVPNNYLEKMQGYADHFDIFILTGAETKREGNLFHNRAYLIAPHKKEMEFQAKNYPTTVPTPELLENWEENLRVVKPPEIKVFETPFGRFCVLVGADIKKLDEYLPFIVREEELDFLVFFPIGSTTGIPENLTISWPRD